MKPELKAMIDAGWVHGLRDELAAQAKNVLRDAFLSSLHWRGDELWAGPILFGYVAHVRTKARWFICVQQSDESPTEDAFFSEHEARAALEAAAKKQINAWFEEQAK